MLVFLRPELSVQFSVGLLDLRASQTEVLLLSRVVRALLDTAATCGKAFSRGGPDGDGKDGRKAVQEKPKALLSAQEDKDDEEFKDDLRTQKFAYVVDKSSGKLWGACGEFTVKS